MTPMTVPSTKVILVAGTWEGNPAWIEDVHDPFQGFLYENNFQPLRHPYDNLPFRWSTKLGGIPMLNRGIWEREGERLARWAEVFTYEFLNFIALSHGGQLVINMAAKFLKREVRSVTTVGTPARADVPAKEAVRNITYWQHILDRYKDSTGMARPRRLAGELFDGKISLERKFLLPGVVNISVPGIRHSDIIRDPSKFHLWVDEGWLDAIRSAGELQVRHRGENEW